MYFNQNTKQPKCAVPFLNVINLKTTNTLACFIVVSITVVISTGPIKILFNYGFKCYTWAYTIKITNKVIITTM